MHLVHSNIRKMDPEWRSVSYWKCAHSIVMLVYWRVNGPSRSYQFRWGRTWTYSISLHRFQPISWPMNYMSCHHGTGKVGSLASRQIYSYGQEYQCTNAGCTACFSYFCVSRKKICECCLKKWCQFSIILNLIVSSRTKTKNKQNKRPK